MNKIWKTIVQAEELNKQTCNVNRINKYGLHPPMFLSLVLSLFCSSNTPVSFPANAATLIGKDSHHKMGSLNGVACWHDAGALPPTMYFCRIPRSDCVPARHKA
jgi:hypothetical protein